MMQKMVNRIYRKKRFDKFKTVSRFEYEQRDVRTKLDIADIYIRLDMILNALEEKDIEVKELDNAEDVMVQMVKEDRLAAKVDIEEVKYQERVKAYEDGKIIEYIRRLFTGDPTSPLFDAGEAAEYNEEKKSSSNKEKEKSEERKPEGERIEDMLISIKERGGVKEATKEEKEDLTNIMNEIKGYINGKENPVAE